MSIFADTGGSGNIQFQQNGVNESYRPTLNFIPGTSVTLSVVDEPSNNRCDVTINASSSGVATVTATSPLFSSGGSSPNITIQVATSVQNGYLSSTDWNTFNSKQPSGNYITALTGDGTATGPGSVAFTLATVNPDVGTYTSPIVTVNGKGLVTSISNGPAAYPVTVVTKNGAYTILSSDNGTYFNIDSSSGTFAFVLPSPSSGFIVRLSDSTGYFANNNVTLEPASGSTLIEGVAGGRVLQTAWGSWLVYSDGTNWFLA